MMRRPLSTICFELARHAANADHETLAYILRMAASEALIKGVEAPSPTSRLAGIWDWDVGNDLNHVDPNGADTLGIDRLQAAKGLPNAAYMRHLHPDDIEGIQAALQKAIRIGGRFEHQYRVLHGDNIRWIAAEGHVTMDSSGRPLRFPGVLHDITHSQPKPRRHLQSINLN